MTRWAWLVLLAAAAPGCVFNRSEIKEPDPPHVEEFTPAPPPAAPLTADQLNEENYREKEKQLEDELEHDGQTPLPSRR